MYKLLLVTNKEDIRQLYTQYSDWENQGFLPPTITDSVRAGIALLSEDRFDVVSWLLPIKEGQKLSTAVMEHSDIIGMETADNNQNLHREISIIRRELISRDFSRNSEERDDILNTLQRDFYCELLRGETYDNVTIYEKGKNLNLLSALDTPIALSSFRLPQGDFFLSEVWKYGRERLENALRNVFESDNSEYRTTLLMINPHHLRLLMVPYKGISENQVCSNLKKHLKSCEINLERYLELTMTIRRVTSYSSLIALSYDNYLKLAQ